MAADETSSTSSITYPQDVIATIRGGDGAGEGTGRDPEVGFGASGASGGGGSGSGEGGGSVRVGGGGVGSSTSTHEHVSSILRLGGALRGMAYMRLLSTIEDINRRIAEAADDGHGSPDALWERLQGFVPRIVLIGDQSAGKSTLVTSITGIPLPRGAGTMVTSCPISVQMQPARGGPKTVQFGSNPPMPLDDMVAVQDRFRREMDAHVDEAARLGKAVTSPDGKKLTTQELSIKVKWDREEQLTVVDLPGLRTDRLGSSVMEMMRSYGRREGTLLLAVMEHSKERDTTEILNIIRSLPRWKQRTVVVNTKCDHVVEDAVMIKTRDRMRLAKEELEHTDDPADSVAEHFVSPANNSDRLLSRDEELQQLRRAPFYGGLVADNKSVGIEELIVRLDSHLRRRVQEMLPRMAQVISDASSHVERRRDALGTPVEPRELLDTVSSEILITWERDIDDAVERSRKQLITALLRRRALLFRDEVELLLEHRPSVSEREEARQWVEDSMRECGVGPYVRYVEPSIRDLTSSPLSPSSRRTPRTPHSHLGSTPYTHGSTAGRARGGGGGSSGGAAEGGGGSGLEDSLEEKKEDEVSPVGGAGGGKGVEEVEDSDMLMYAHYPKEDVEAVVDSIHEEMRASLKKPLRPTKWERRIFEMMSLKLTTVDAARETQSRRPFRRVYENLHAHWRVALLAHLEMFRDVVISNMQKSIESYFDTVGNAHLHLPACIMANAREELRMAVHEAKSALLNLNHDATNVLIVVHNENPRIFSSGDVMEIVREALDNIPVQDLGEGPGRVHTVIHADPEVLLKEVDKAIRDRSTDRAESTTQVIANSLADYAFSGAYEVAKFAHAALKRIIVKRMSKWITKFNSNEVLLHEAQESRETRELRRDLEEKLRTIQECDARLRELTMTH